MNRVRLLSHKLMLLSAAVFALFCLPPRLLWAEADSNQQPVGDLTVASEHGCAVPTFAVPDTNCLPVACPLDYWVVSSRCCLQEMAPGCPSCDLQVFRYTAQTGLQRSSLPELIAATSPSVPMAINVHGSFVSWEDILEQAGPTAGWLRRAAPGKPLQMVFFTWPSDISVAPIPQITIDQLGRRAETNGRYLAGFLSCVPANVRVSIIGHSHGARAAAAAMHLMAGGIVRGCHGGTCQGPSRVRLIFAAAAFNHDWLNHDGRYYCAINRTECVLNLRTRCDAALLAYAIRWPISKRALGTTGFTGKDHADFGWQTTKLADCDVKPLLRVHHVWPYYYAQPQIASWMAPYVHFLGEPAVGDEVSQTSGEASATGELAFP